MGSGGLGPWAVPEPCRQQGGPARGTGRPQATQPKGQGLPSPLGTRRAPRLRCAYLAHVHRQHKHNFKYQASLTYLFLRKGQGLRGPPGQGLPPTLPSDLAEGKVQLPNPVRGFSLFPDQYCRGSNVCFFQQRKEFQL